MKFTTDFTTISAKARIDIMDAIRNDLNAETVFICKDSNHQDDFYLYLYIAKAKDDTYITGLANTSKNYGVGLYENHYNCTFKRALEILADKIHDCNRNEEV